MRSKIGWGLMTFFSLLTVLLVSPYLTLDPEIFFPEQRFVYLAHLNALLFHVSGGVIALTIGPFLFVNRLRIKWPHIHRWLGRLYMLGILVGGLAGLVMAANAYGGIISRSGFAMVGLLWLATGLMAFIRIREGNVAEHRRWMIRNFALSLAAVMLRIQSPLLSQLLDFEIAYRIIAWTAWLPNLLVAEWLVRRSRAQIVPVARQPSFSLGR